MEKWAGKEKTGIMLPTDPTRFPTTVILGQNHFILSSVNVGQNKNNPQLESGFVEIDLAWAINTSFCLFRNSLGIPKVAFRIVRKKLQTWQFHVDRSKGFGLILRTGFSWKLLFLSVSSWRLQFHHL